MENGKSFTNNEKSAAKSKTIIFNFISAIVVMWPIVAPFLGFNFNLNAEQISILAGAICACNIFLRKMTKNAIFWIKKKEI